jgi:ABC-type transport system substrate-binding protein
MNVWLSTGATHLWRLDRRGGPLAWEAEIDRLMQAQLASTDHAARKRAFDRVQEIAAEHLPVVPLASPHFIVAARSELGNLRPSVIDHSALWNSDEIYWRGGPPERRR